jgi:large subunit ribosomal protein L32
VSRGGGLTLAAVDWSGSRDAAARSIWTAVVRDGRPSELWCGLDREATVERLLARLAPGARAVIGLDFAFSLPAWRVTGGPEALWAWAAEEEARERRGQRRNWVLEQGPPFWGPRLRPRPALPDGVPAERATDRETPGAQSPFKLTGIGSVGAQSLRGMAQLHRMRRRGLAIWPLTAPGWPRAVEIYPRALVARAGIRAAEARDPHGRRAALERAWPGLPAGWRHAAAASRDAFDAMASVLAMWRWRADLLARAFDVGPPYDLEGAIWVPGTGPGWRPRFGIASLARRSATRSEEHMAVPKRKTSKQRRDTRRATHAIEGARLARCPRCSSPVRPHHVCGVCGYYRGRQVIDTEA